MDHYWLVANRLLEGRVIPFLGAGANLCGRRHDATWSVGSHLPSGAELATYLADKSRYPDDPAGDLLRVHRREPSGCRAAHRTASGTA